MKSFAVAIEPAANPGLAACLTLGHACAAALPWLAHCPPALAAAGSAAALAGLCASLAWVPGPHCPLQAVEIGPAGCRARLAGDASWQSATLTRAACAYAGMVALEVSAGGRRRGWLLPRKGLPGPAFRRLKVLIRLAC